MSDHKPETLLLTVSGKDRPGVTSAVFAALTKAGVEVLDIEQIVLRRRLILGILVTAPRDWKRLRDTVQATADDLGMSVDIDHGTGDNKVRREGRSHVTVIGAPLKAAAMAAVAGRIADSGANIDRIERMARYPVTAIDLHVSGANPDRLRALLALEAAAQGVDIAVQPASLLRRAMRLIVMDVDSTLIQGEVIELLALHSGHGAEVARVTERAMRGELDFEESLRERVALLAGIPSTALDEVYDELVLAPGARTLVRTLRRLGYRFALVSGGFSQITDRLAAGPRHPLRPRQRARDRRRHDHRTHRRRRGRPRREGRCGALLRRAGRRADGVRGGDRRRRQRSRHARDRGTRHRLQRQGAGAGGRRHDGQRPLPRRDHVPARHQPRGDRGARRRARRRHPRAPV